jgi:hypothetical protein
MKKNNSKVSQQKAKRYAKNKKRLKDKPQLSKFERRQLALREQIVGPFLRSVNNNE